MIICIFYNKILKQLINFLNVRCLIVIVIYNHFRKFNANFKIKILNSQYIQGKSQNISMYFYIVDILI